MLRSTVMLVGTIWTTAVMAGDTSLGTPTVQAKIVNHKVAYNPKPERGPHLDVKVTPPESRGEQGKVLVEVYNRGKDHLALVQFDVTLTNHGGFEISAPVKAEDLRPNMSGSQWVKIPRIKGKFPTIDGARMANIRTITDEAKEVKMNGYMDLIKN